MIEKIKVLRTALLLFSVVSLTGCFKQDYSICPPERNVRLDFRLIGEENFTQHVTSVDAYIYDAAGTYLRTERIEEHHLGEHEGMYLTLDPGDYRMVFWANLNGNTSVTGHEGDSGEVGHADHRHNDEGVLTVNGDQLWYGPSTPPTRATRGTPQEHYALSVPEEGEHSDVIHFTHAHRSLEIYVKGLADQPTVDVEGLPVCMEHQGMETKEGTVNASHETSPVEKDGVGYAATVFDTLYFEDMDGIVIVIRNAAGAELYRTTLADAIAQSEADPDGRVIQLVFTFLNGTVKVGLPAWESTHPGFEL